MRNTPTNPKERTSVTLPRWLARKLSLESEVTGRPASAIVRDALQQYFAQHEDAPLPPFVGIGASGYTNTGTRAEELFAESVGRKHPRRPKTR